MFSYLLGDNHPHVLAMPFVILMIALIFNLFLQRNRLVGLGAHAAARLPQDELPVRPGLSLVYQRTATMLATGRTLVQTLVPLGWSGAISLLVTGSALVFLNTWDFPPYGLLLLVVIGLLVRRALLQAPTLSNTQRWRQTVVVAAASGGVLLVGLVALLWPYFLTAQSQAGGLLPNLFNPSHVAQFFVMFGFALVGLCALFGLSWQGVAKVQPLPTQHWRALGLLAALVYGLPLLFLALSAILVLTPRGQQLLAGLPLPAGATSYWPFIVQRWGSQFWTFLLIGALLTSALWLLWRYIELFWDRQKTPLATELSPGEETAPTTTLFVLLLAALGLLLVFAPEFVYLRDNFGIRMNTVFKFYYQAWLLFGVVLSYAIVVVLSEWLGPERSVPATGQSNPWLSLGTISCAVLALLLGLSGLVYPLTGVYSKTGGFNFTPTFDVGAYLADQGSAELAAVVWVRTHTAPDALVVEGKGNSYWNHNRISTMTGRPTLLGWESHEEQWRGKAYGAMAQGRVAALETIYRSRTTAAIAQVVAQWQIDYVYVGPTERLQYAITPESERGLAGAMKVAFEQGNVRIYQRR